MLYHDQPVLERVSAVPGDIGRLASQVFTLGDEGPAGQAPDADRSSSVATSATAATPAANEVATQPQGVAPLASMAADPESALASTPQPPITPASTVVGPQALAAPTLSIDAQTALRDGRVASAGETTLPATSAAAATPAAAAPGTPDPLTAAPSAGETAPLGTPAASTRAAASATEAADPVAAASTTSADRGGARALLASLESGGPASGGAAPAGVGADDRVVLVASQESWVQVRSRDRQYVRTWTLQAGERFTVPDRGDLALWTGNAGGLDVLVDGRNLGALGPDGHVMRDVPLTAEGLRARLSASR